VVAVRDAVDDAVGFAAALRRAALDVSPGDVAQFVRAAEAVDPSRIEELYWAGRATLVHRPEDFELYELVFGEYWMSLAPRPKSDPVAPIAVLLDDRSDDDNAADGDDGPTEPDEVLSVRYSAREILSRKDFALCTEEELAEAYRLMAQFAFDGAQRRSRRYRRVAHGRRLDLRRTIADSLRTDGELIRRHYTDKRMQSRRMVFLIDVSGSMEHYARALVRFVQAAVVGAHRVEAFTLGTRLTRITRQLSDRDPDRAVAAASAAVKDWSGGTRLGESIGEFNSRWGVRGMARGAVVVVLSDGWDRGDPTVMDEQMQRLARVAHRVIWVNPLKSTDGYAPLAAGMAAALPHVDDFVEGESLDALAALARTLSNASARDRVVSGSFNA
jgi:uncharacterized protein with von Willebrand factor type A (vWA) domain